MNNSLVSNIKQQKQTVYSLAPDAVYAALFTCVEGLNSQDAKERLTAFGENRLKEARKTPLVVKLLSNFTHLMALLLWVAGVMAFIAGMPQLGIAVWMVNLINGAFSFWQEFRAERATDALKKMLPSYVRVFRDAAEQRLLAEELVPGDIILLNEGDSISADCRLVESAELRTDQSTLTGESRPVSKSVFQAAEENRTFTEMPNLVFAGTHVASGTGKAVVFATGMDTEFGKIATLTQSMEQQLSPLQKEMEVVTRNVTIIALLMGVVFFFLAVLLAGVTLFESFIFAIGMVVAFVPEGLLPTVTLALAMGTQRMAKRHALIKRLSAVETLGCTSVICTDKTGTLTQNEMTVKSIWLPDLEPRCGSGTPSGRLLDVTGTGYEPQGQVEWQGRVLAAANDDDLRHFLIAANLCNNSRLLPPTNTNGEESRRWSVLGDPTEAAIRVVALKAGFENDEIEKQVPRLNELPFESRRKRMSTIHMVRREQRISSGTQQKPFQRVAYVKGAPREVLELCTSTHVGDQDCPMDEALRAEVMRVNDEYARDGLRVLAVAQRTLPDDLLEFTPENVEAELSFLGLLAEMDPPRPEVAKAVEKCHSAGIRVVMITGDYGLTAESIARRIGIVRGQNPRIITGFELDTLSDEQLIEALHEEVIFARVAPEHKLKVVSTLQEMGEVVAVTGDGVNDAPALKKANIGVAMGITGTDVAKEAAAMILTDDNFASIINAIEEGRAVYANIKKFTSYIFTSNTPEAIPFILFAFSAGRIPIALNVMHVLAVDLGTDIVPALALGSEPPEPGVMQRPPRDLKEHVITKSLLLRAYPWLGMMQALASMAAFYYMFWMNGHWGQWIDLPADGMLYRSATAMALAAVVTTQIGNLFAHRSERISAFRLPVKNNPLLLVGILSELVVIALIVYTPVMNTFIGTAPFPLSYWVFLFAWTPSLLILDELRKAYLNRKERKHAQ